MKVHFIATGGTIMYQLSSALLKKGYEVGGSDDETVASSETFPKYICQESKERIRTGLRKFSWCGYAYICETSNG